MKFITSLITTTSSFVLVSSFCGFIILSFLNVCFPPFFPPLRLDDDEDDFSFIPILVVIVVVVVDDDGVDFNGLVVRFMVSMGKRTSHATKAKIIRRINRIRSNG